MTRSPAESDRRRGRLALLFVAVLVACRGGEAGPPPERTALALFELARGGEPSEERLTGLLERVPRDEAGRAALFDVLETLGRAAPPRVSGVTASEGEADAFVDLVVALPGEGEARYSVRLVDVGSGAWRVRWIKGPALEWPRRARVQGDGLSSSAPVEAGR